MSGFDPRSRTGSDGDLGLSTENIARFRSTLPHGERPKRPVGPPICLRFDPRSRTGSDASSVRGVARHRVSIHAPARGATPAPAGDSPAWLFRSTLPHGERASTDRIPGVQRRFDPRSRTGSDAPTSAGRRRWPRFDPRSRTGSDPGTFFCESSMVCPPLVANQGGSLGRSGSVFPLIQTLLLFSMSSALREPPRHGMVATGSRKLCHLRRPMVLPDPERALHPYVPPGLCPKRRGGRNAGCPAPDQPRPSDARVARPTVPGQLRIRTRNSAPADHGRDRHEPHVSTCDVPLASRC